MLTLVAVILAVLFLPAVWGWLAVLAALAIDILEVIIWLRMRGRRSISGEDAIVGAVARVMTVCRPEGRVRLQGQIWNAYCPEGAEPGDEVTVTSVEGLVLTVRRLPTDARQSRPA
jgi:membrane-bound serine protease (ClpP class)